MNLSVPLSHRSALLDFFIENERNFIVRSTNYTVSFKSAEHKFVLTESGIGYKILGLMSKTKSDCKKVLHRIPESAAYRVKLSQRKETEDFDNVEVFQYDKTAAYTNAALRLGVISPETYKAIMNVDKRFRMFIIGSLATRATIETYSDGVRVKTERQEKETRKAWDLITKEVEAEVMKLFIENACVFAFWVDAIYSFARVSTHPSYREKRFLASIRQRQGLRMFVGGKQYLHIP